nr:unnamed protein product [Callosobruchus chinensis]
MRIQLNTSWTCLSGEHEVVFLFL